MENRTEFNRKTQNKQDLCLAAGKSRGRRLRRKGEKASYVS